MLIAIAYGNVYKICYHVCNYFGTSFAIRVPLQATEMKFAWNISPKA